MKANPFLKSEKKASEPMMQPKFNLQDENIMTDSSTDDRDEN